ncbi:ATP-binding protein [Streptomyces sp. NPDC059752]|uniref:ATP-binding protein n=1 Tax=unclassified Streptomyces TaxID=2593676 RepID=UPI00364C06EA
MTCPFRESRCPHAAPLRTPPRRPGRDLLDHEDAAGGPCRSRPVSSGSWSTERAERKATAVAANSPFAEWDETFGDPRLCVAIADRTTFRCTLIQTGTESYRFRITEAGRRG